MAKPISTSYSDEEKAEIIAHVLIQVATGRFVSRVFREDKTTAQGISLPSASTFWKWVFEDTSGELSEKLVRAREFGIEAILDETLDIADETISDTIRDENGTERPNSEWISRSRLRIETRTKLAQMLKPKTYGAKLDVTSGGEKLNEVDDTARAIRLAAVLSAIPKHDDA
jgi:hypothetical protein